MDKIWDRKSFEVGGQWPFGGDEKTYLIFSPGIYYVAVIISFVGLFIC